MSNKNINDYDYESEDDEYDFNDGFLVKDKLMEEINDDLDDYEPDENNDDYETDDDTINESLDDEEFINEDNLVLVIKGKNKESLKLKKFIKDSKLNEEQIKDIEKFKDLLEKSEEKEEYFETFFKMNNDEKNKCISFLENIKNNNNKNLILQLLLSDIPDKTKYYIWNMVTSEIDNSVNSGKYTGFLMNLLKIPFGKYSENNFYNIKQTKTIISNTIDELNKIIYGHEEAKHFIIKYLSNHITNNNIEGKIFALIGPPGIGKTCFVEGLSKIFNKPFGKICLGGYNDTSSLEGFGYTYEGSRPGEIVKILQNTNRMDPIISLDEVDKIDKESIINLLIHLLDPIQNKTFHDKYFGDIDIDLSKVTWVLTYNNANLISNILRDRIVEIHLNGFTDTEKFDICKNFIIPSMYNKYNIDITFTDDIILHLIYYYSPENGVRKIKQIIEDIFLEVNYQIISKKIKKKNILINIKNYKNFLKFKHEITIEKIHTESKIGKINALYASSGYRGGIIPVEVSWFPSDSILELKKTGNIQKIMKESEDVAKTVAWNLIPEELKEEYRTKWKNNKEGIHIHCSSSSEEKEGPSAGLAITISILSLLLKKPIKNNIGITGEIDLSGNALEIGGLRDKFFGAKRAGCSLVLFPSENLKDYNEILVKNPELIDNTFSAIPISHISEVLKYIFI
jgi:ATP-dependent Lon protease